MAAAHSPLRQNYDAVVVATGRYNAPNIPNIHGLKEWNTAFTGKLQHSRQYRRPETYEGKTVLIIGAGVRFLAFHLQLSGANPEL